MFSVGLIFIPIYNCNKWSSFRGLPSVELTKVHCATICSWIIDRFDVNLYKVNYLLFLLKYPRMCLEDPSRPTPVIDVTSLVNLLTDCTTLLQVR